MVGAFENVQALGAYFFKVGEAVGAEEESEDDGDEIVEFFAFF